ncbi:MAG: GIY-YIG nuclease family protein [Patescibacteria group bacterium]|nr:GIY-YIG nuclease family protein [Patescibacteria group bacterium]
MLDYYQFYTYILASNRNGTLYIGVTNNLKRRVFEHKQGEDSAFTAQHYINKLVYYEMYESIEEAIMREKQLKKWNRSWKIRLIEDFNPLWSDLYDNID